MFLLDTGKLDINSALESLRLGANKPLLNIASVITKEDHQFKYEYTIFREFIKLIASVNIDEIVSKILNDLANTSTPNDNQNSQFTSLNSTQSLNANYDESNNHQKYNCLPLRQMLESCFATYIPQTCVIK